MFGSNLLHTNGSFAEHFSWLPQLLQVFLPFVVVCWRCAPNIVNSTPAWRHRFVSVGDGWGSPLQISNPWEQRPDSDLWSDWLFQFVYSISDPSVQINFSPKLPPGLFVGMYSVMNLPANQNFTGEPYLSSFTSWETKQFSSSLCMEARWA